MAHSPIANTLLTQDPRRRRGKLVFAGNEAHLARLIDALQRRAPRLWNRWREAHPRIRPDLRGVVLSGRALPGLDLTRARLDAAVLRRTDLNGAWLTGASLRGADLERADLSWAHAERVDLSGAGLRGASLRKGRFGGVIGLGGTSFVHANLREADFTRAKLAGADLSEADLTRTLLDGADLSGAVLGNAVLDGTSFLGASLREAQVYGALIRRVRTDDRTDQRSLDVDVHVVWDRRHGKIVEFTEADDIHVAQFHDIVDEHGSVAKLLAATTKRVVLILGRFLPRRKRVLDRLAEALRNRGKVAVIFDFPGPQDREISDTVRFIAGMAQFVVVDMTKASSVPLELQATIPDLMIPVLPIVESGKEIFAMFSDLQRRYFWIQPPVSYKDADDLVRHVDEAIIARAERAADEIRKRRAASVRPPVSVARAALKTKSPRRRA
jgi:uncharacterized protein YjbI with pentapeptide repeats